MIRIPDNIVLTRIEAEARAEFYRKEESNKRLVAHQTDVHVFDRELGDYRKIRGYSVVEM
jgi:hypothetical protein